MSPDVQVPCCPVRTLCANKVLLWRTVCELGNGRKLAIKVRRKVVQR